ncbi:hypothetical protein GTQ99_14030 [Kineococcus sp. T13]|uniref:hypothetical protein n=1 Tax=Kineococcus vitellinus TaxID=2696565 RepID=UPI001413141B|nr:hypothetical protein [Kineococcus vitellinus]NAZ76525.1 hypothetical protein [Kineococcus vitellinus]
MRVLVTGATGSAARSVLQEALQGVDRLYPAPAPATAQRVVAAARDAGVSRVVDLSGEDAGWYVDTVLAGSAAGGAARTPVVRELLGRPATTFARWARQHAGEFRG